MNNLAFWGRFKFLLTTTHNRGSYLHVTQWVFLDTIVSLQFTDKVTLIISVSQESGSMM